MLERRRAFDHALGPWLDKLLLNHPNTAVIALGDHGARGYQNEKSIPAETSVRNPFLSVSFPKSFLSANPKATRALAVNENRMVNMFDIYASIRQLGAAGGVIDKPLKEMQLPHMPAKARSIFEEIETTRSCESVGTLITCICSAPLSPLGGQFKSEGKSTKKGG
jgi:hypothetical protein